MADLPLISPNLHKVGQIWNFNFKLLTFCQGFAKFFFKLQKENLSIIWYTCFLNYLINKESKGNYTKLYRTLIYYSKTWVTF